MTFENAVKRVIENPNVLYLKFGPYDFVYKDGQFYDSKDRIVNFTDEEKQLDCWKVLSED